MNIDVQKMIYLQSWKVQQSPSRTVHPALHYPPPAVFSACIRPACRGSTTLSAFQAKRINARVLTYCQTRHRGLGGAAERGKDNGRRGVMLHDTHQVQCRNELAELHNWRDRDELLSVPAHDIVHTNHTVRQNPTVKLIGGSLVGCDPGDTDAATWHVTFRVC